MANLQSQNEIKRDDFKSQREYQIAMLKNGTTTNPSTPQDYTQNVQVATQNLLSNPDMNAGET